MQAIYKSVLATMMILAGVVHAQENIRFGFISLIYVAVDDKPCHLKICGTSLNDAGLRPGQNTGGLVMPVGKVKLDLEVEGLENATGEVLIKGNETSAYAIFPQKTIDPKTKKIELKLRIQNLSVEKKGKFNLEIISLCSEPVTVQVAGKYIRLKALKQNYLPEWNGGVAKIKYKKGAIGEVEGAEPGEYIAIIAEDLDGKHRAFSHRLLTHYLPEGYGQEP